MQNVEGSSPFSRLYEALQIGGFLVGQMGRHAAIPKSGHQNWSSTRMRCARPQPPLPWGRAITPDSTPDHGLPAVQAPGFHVRGAPRFHQAPDLAHRNVRALRWRRLTPVPRNGLHSCWRGSAARRSYNPRECEKCANALFATRGGRPALVIESRPAPRGCASSLRRRRRQYDCLRQRAAV